MLLTVSLTRAPATDLGYLLHKHPERCQSFDLSFGVAHVAYPEAAPDRCTAALVVDVDPIELARGKPGSPRGRLLTDYVNDRPYAASSFLSVALGRVYRTAMAGRCEARPELVDEPLPLEAWIPAVACKGGPDVLEFLFGPLGYEVSSTILDLDESFPEWGPSSYVSLGLRGTVRLRDLLAHLYVLIPVLDVSKHYWIGDDEVAKLLRHGEGWLASHPERETIAHRYLPRRRSLARTALAQLVEVADPDEPVETGEAGEEQLEEKIRLHDLRMGSVMSVLKAAGARRVVDLGCGSGKLLERLIADPDFTEIVGLDVSHRTLEFAERRLNLERLAPHARERIRLIHGSLTYRDHRIEGFDAAAVVEVIEHLDPWRLGTFERVLFEAARPRTVVLTTPNREYNVLFEGLEAGELRHRDHRFEWTRSEFEDWARTMSERYGYEVRILGVGPSDPELGPPTQMAVFMLAGTAS